MAKEYDFICSAHPVVVGGDREQAVYFSTPDEINDQTGVLLLIAGFGGRAEANVYKKMRRVFADQYNLVVVQTDYIGTEFMEIVNDYGFDERYFDQVYNSLPHNIRDVFVDSEGKLKVDQLLATELPCNTEIPLCASISEEANNYVEMGPIQAIDCVNALITVQEILKENGYQIDAGKVIVSGHSHGAYLGLLANRLFPGLFSLVVDGAGWLLPEYLTKPRVIQGYFKKHKVFQVYNYRITSEPHDVQIRDLRYLYRSFDNLANIITFQFVDDHLVNVKEKANILEKVPFSIIEDITLERVDGITFKSTAHGDFDFLNLFHYVMEKYPSKAHRPNLISQNTVSVEISTEMAHYKFYIANGGPHMEALTK